MSVEGDGFSLIVNGTECGTFCGATSGDELVVKAIAAAEAGAALSASVTLGTYTTAWAVTTIDTTGIVIASDVFDYNLLDDLVTNYGYDGSSAVDVEITIAESVVVGASSTSGPAFDTGSLPDGSHVTIINNGYIVGAGGRGGIGTNSENYGGTKAWNGGPALHVRVSTIVDNQGIIGGGGGGGGGGYGRVVYNAAGGGGGGAGAVPGAGGPRQGEANGWAEPGQPGTLLAGGVGGRSTEDMIYGGSWVGSRHGYHGGGLGQNGSGANAGGTGPGLAGAAVIGDGLVTWINAGDRRGRVE